jgi:beta-glucosidase
MKKMPFSIFLCLLFVTALFGQVYKDPTATVQARVADLLSRMSLAQKIGQMTQGNSTEVTTSDIQTYFLGSVLSGGGSYPGANTPSGWADATDNYQRAAMGTSLGIPIIYGIDAVHGCNAVQDATVFPHNIGLGAANDPDLMLRIGQTVANEVACTGIDWTFAPCVTVPRDERWGRTYEGFSEDPSIHNNLVRPYIQGLQGTTMGGQNIVACAKHYIADGGTTGGVNMGDAAITEAQLRAIHLPPYQRAIEQSVGTVMVSFSKYNGVLCSQDTQLVTSILKTELGFKGFVVSDWDALDMISGTASDQAKAAINAGIDMVMYSTKAKWSTFITSMTSLVNSGSVPTSRIDDAVSRILTVKFTAGLFEAPYADRSFQSSFGSDAHRQIAREAVRKSLVLLKNNGVLPLSKTARLFVAGKSADSMTNQCGGWTLGWQGIPAGQTDKGTTVLGAIKKVATGTVTYSATGTGASGYDAAVVVVGETPYAETLGDKTDLSLDSTDQTCISNIQASGVPYVIVLVSGRPMIVTSQIQNANAFVAAWLPGTEGDGVADCLYGTYDFTGKLAYSWPSSMSQIPINTGDTSYSPLYAFGYGLTLSGTVTPAPTAVPTIGPTAVPTVVPTVAPTPVPGLTGDVNSNGSIDIVDALLTAQYYVGLNPAGFNTAVADVNCSGTIDIVDALRIAQYYVGLIASLSC